MVVHNVRTAEEWKETLKEHNVVVLDCFATWCGPCKAIAPLVVKYVLNIYNGHKHSENADFKGIRFVKIDVDEVPDVSQELGIRAMPTFMIFNTQEKTQEIVGANPPALEKAIIALAATPEAKQAKAQIEEKEKAAAAAAEEPKQE
ncbi:thioredoxin [Colletotrichum paranaense]|uniref:Thioredoxin n=1 Tax=Colletotrichum paranaense TaxID=1914294 RepID=A0ABQ9SVU4_9PEZI|nr:thioredoxin [Colletotrichum paranaense]KAK1543632.1 thioredoxin [Colletotrichum paranaense]